MTELKNPHQNLYKEEYCEMLKEHMALGHSFESFAGVVEVSAAVLYDWKHHHKEFKKAFQVGHAKSLLFFEKKGINGMDYGKQFNDGVWKYSMSNRFGWSDKNQINFTEPSEMSRDEIQKEIAKIDEALKNNEF